MHRILIVLVTGWAVFNGQPKVLATEVNSLPKPLDATVGWPEATNVSRPWTRWWWLGSAVDTPNLTRLLETYHAAGLGGVEITSLYGVHGAEKRELKYLSPQWVDALRHSAREAKRLGMGVDLPTGSGWRTGGPSVTEADEDMELVLKKEAIEGGGTFRCTFDGTLPQLIVAYGDEGQVVDLSDRIAADLPLEWQAPPGKWTLYTSSERWSRDNVKRPAPGGEGRNINPLSRRSLEDFLAYFGKALGNAPADGIRAQFHDSYEYEGNWCDDFYAQFEKRRGYKLEHHLPALNGEGDPADVARVKHDYRETVSDLILESMIEPWTAWSHEHGMLSRNQSHGSPANWLDLYAACDIPEIESFGRLQGGNTNRLVFMFAASAAHVTGKPLVSSESATWLDEHFNETLDEVKEIVDRLFLGGVNHVFYHGTAYSPADAVWPGWLFYASSELNPQNPLWRDFGALNQYVTRCQSVLQATRPDDDILLYWPIHDFWQDPRGLRKDIRVHNSREWLDDTEFGRTAESLVEHGYTIDYISDRQIVASEVEDGKIKTPGGRYATLVIPGAKTLPLSTAQAIIRLAENGATIVSCGETPAGTPGWKHNEEQAEFDELARRFMPRMKQQDGYSRADLGSGLILIADDLQKALAALGVRQEKWASADGLQFLRKVWSGGSVYFINNVSAEPIDEEIDLTANCIAAIFMDPATGRIGLADTDAKPGRVRLQLDPGESIFVKSYRGQFDYSGPAWQYREPIGEPMVIEGAVGRRVH